MKSVHCTFKPLVVINIDRKQLLPVFHLYATTCSTTPVEDAAITWSAKHQQFHTNTCLKEGGSFTFFNCHTDLLLHDQFEVGINPISNGLRTPFQLKNISLTICNQRFDYKCNHSHSTENNTVSTNIP